LRALCGHAAGDAAPGALRTHRGAVWEPCGCAPWRKSRGSCGRCAGAHRGEGQWQGSLRRLVG